jgi:hypothetical protein
MEIKKQNKQHLFLISSRCMSTFIFFESTESHACDTPGPIRHGSVLTWGGNLLVEFVCDDGYFPIGDVFGACVEEDGVWTIDSPICVGKG